MNTTRFTTATLSRAGGRAYNEDCVGHSEHCWVLADGLGGHGGGEVASRIAVERVLAALAGAALTPAALIQAIEVAHAAIQAEQRSAPRLERMRTTLVVLLGDGREALWAHVGDSRLYHFRGGRVAFQTEDHSVPQAMVRAGELRPAEIRHHEDRNRLLRTLGNDDAPRPTLAPAPLLLKRGDAFLLCSDGFWEFVTETEMEITLAKAADPDGWLLAMTGRLLGRADPEHDNFSAIAIFVH